MTAFFVRVNGVFWKIQLIAVEQQYYVSVFNLDSNLLFRGHSAHAGMELIWDVQRYNIFTDSWMTPTKRICV
jgi:hypothetical protein